MLHTREASIDSAAPSPALIEAHGLASEQRRAAEELLEHARLLEERIRRELEQAHPQTESVPSARVDGSAPVACVVPTEFEAALDAASRDLREMEAHLVAARHAWERLEAGCRTMRASAPAPTLIEVSDEAAQRVVARRAADAARRHSATVSST